MTQTVHASTPARTQRIIRFSLTVDVGLLERTAAGHMRYANGWRRPRQRGRTLCIGCTAVSAVRGM